MQTLSPFFFYYSRKQLESQRSPIASDLRLGRGLVTSSTASGIGGGGGRREDVAECLRALEEEWSELCDHAEVWQNRVDNALANMRIFEKDLQTLEKR